MHRLILDFVALNKVKYYCIQLHDIYILYGKCTFLKEVVVTFFPSYLGVLKLQYVLPLG